MARTKKKTKAPGNRKPHNAKTANYASFDELLALIAAEPRNAFLGDEQVTMPRGERLLRLMLDRALKGHPRDVTKLLQMMAKNPATAATFRDEFVTVIGGVLARL